MKQRTLLAIAGALTAIMVLALGGTAWAITHRSAASQAESLQPLAAPAVAPVQAPAAAPNAADPSQQASVSPRVAAQIALNVAPGSTLTRQPDLVDFNGVVAYEVQLDQGLVYVDANTGQILSNATQAPAVNNGTGGFGGFEGGEHEQNEHSGRFFGHDD